MHKVDNKRTWARWKGKVWRHGHATRGELLSQACRYRDGVTWSILLDSKAKATLYLTEVKMPAEGRSTAVHAQHDCDDVSLHDATCHMV